MVERIEHHPFLAAINRATLEARLAVRLRL
jgi:hypothetical protein